MLADLDKFGINSLPAIAMIKNGSLVYSSSPPPNSIREIVSKWRQSEDKLVLETPIFIKIDMYRKYLYQLTKFVVLFILKLGYPRNEIPGLGGKVRLHNLSIHLQRLHDFGRSIHRLPQLLFRKIKCGFNN